MATQLLIKRTTGNALPASLASGELVYVEGAGANGERLYVGSPAANDTPLTIGGVYFTNMLDHTAGVNTADSAAIVDSAGKIDVWNVDNITLDGNSITSTDANGNILLQPNGTGGTVMYNPYVDAATAGEATDITLEEYVQKFGGKTVITQDGLNNVVDGAANSVTIGIDDLGIANVKLVNDGITIGSTDMSLGETHTDLVGLTSVVVDNMTLDGNDIAATGDISLTPSTGIISSVGSIIPSADSTYDLGSATNKWQTLYVDGAAFSDVTVGVDATNAVGTTVGSGFDLILGSDSGTIDMQGSVTVSGTHNVTGAGQYQTTLQVMGDTTAGANLSVVLDTSLSGNLTQVMAGGGTADFGAAGNETVGTVVGSWTVDELTMDGSTITSTTNNIILDSAALVESDSHFIPSVDSDGVLGYDLGSLTNRWRNLYAHSSSFGNVRIAGADDQTIDTVAGDLVLDSFTGETVMNDNFTVNGTVDIVGVTTVTGDTTVTGNTILDGNTTLNTGTFTSNATSNSFANIASFTSAVSMDDSLRVDDVFVDSNIISTVGLGSDLILDPNTDTGGTGNGQVVVDSHLFPMVDSDGTTGYDLGSPTDRWRNLFAHSSTFGDIRIAGAADNEIDTVSMDLVLDSFTGITTMDDDVTVTGTFTSTGAATMSSTLGVTGAATLSDTLSVTGATNLLSTLDVTGNTTLAAQLDANGDVNLGTDGTNTVTFLADVDSNILPSVDGSDGVSGFDLGSPTDMWRNIYAANGYITIGTDQVLLGATITDVNGLTSLDVDNMTLDGNVISTADTDGNLSLEPNGQGTVIVPSDYITRTGFVDDSLVTKAYVDNAIEGLDIIESARVATTANIADLANHGTIDGVTLSAGDRVLVKDQTNTAENGVYESDGTGLTRTEDANTPAEIDGGTFIFVAEGTFANQGFVTTHNYEPVIDTDPIIWTQFSGAGQIDAGAAMSKTGNTLDVNVDDSTIEVAADALQVKDLGILNQHIADTTIDLTAKVTNVLPTDNGGTGIATPAANSLLVGSGANPMTELASAGTTVGYVLQNDATGAPVWNNVVDGGTY